MSVTSARRLFVGVVGIALFLTRSADAAELTVGGFMLDANAGVPAFGSKDFRVNVDGTVGYVESELFGGYIHGERSVISTKESSRDLLDVRSGAHGQFFLHTPADRPIGFAGGASFDFTQYLTSLTLLDGSGTDSDQLSNTLRGTADGTFWWNRGNFAIRAQASAGFLHERFSEQLAVVTGPDAGFTQTDIGTDSLALRARARFVWRFLPGVLRGALLGRLDSFQLTRSSTTIKYDFGQTYSQQSVLLRTNRLEVLGRAMVDIEALAIASWIFPGVFAQVEMVRSSNDAGSTSTMVTTFGAGLRSDLPF